MERRLSSLLNCHFRAGVLPGEETMNSPITIRARAVAITLLSAIAVFGFGKAGYATSATSVAGAGVASEAVVTCNVAPEWSPHDIPAAGESFVVTVFNYGQCFWSATPSVPWITVTPSSGNLPVISVVIKVAPNSGPKRTGVILFGSGPSPSVITIEQNGPCTYKFDVTSLNIGNGHAFGYLNLTASDNFSPCPRGATSDAGWLKIVSGNNLSGSGSIGYTVDANLGPNRMGKITLGNATFTVTQAGGCDYKLSPSIFNFPSGNGGSSIQVVASSDSCDWSPVSS